MTPLDDAVPTDEQIVAAVLAGRRDAFRTLFERHHGPLVRYLTAQTADPALAEDLAQNAFLVAFRDLGVVATGRPFAPWLYRIAQHRLRRAWRRRRLSASSRSTGRSRRPGSSHRGCACPATRRRPAANAT